MDKWDKRFIELADTIGEWSSCFKENRHVGAVVVRNKRILTTGYNGAPAGIRSCARHELCYAVHAEQNAIIQAARMGVSIEGATLYCTHFPCVICAKIIANSGISRLVYRHSYPDEFSAQLLAEAGLSVERFEEAPAAE